MTPLVVPVTPVTPVTLTYQTTVTPRGSTTVSGTVMSPLTGVVQLSTADQPQVNLASLITRTTQLLQRQTVVLCRVWTVSHAFQIYRLLGALHLDVVRLTNALTYLLTYLLTSQSRNVNMASCQHITDTETVFHVFSALLS